MVDKKLDTAISVGLLPITAVAMGAAFYLTSINIWMFPSIPLAGTLFGISCMGPNRMKKYKETGDPGEG